VTRTFKELSPFTARLGKRLDAESYRRLQLHLLDHPEAGAVMPRTGGWRKLRWAPTGHGKRGGVRVIYYLRTASHVIYFADLYDKGEKATLSRAEEDALRAITQSLP